MGQVKKLQRQCDWAWARRQIEQTLNKYLQAYEMDKVGTETMRGWPCCQLLGCRLWLRRQGGKWFRCGIRKVKNQKHASGLWMKLKDQLENSFQWFCHFSPAASKLGVKLICYSRSTLRQQKYQILELRGLRISSTLFSVTIFDSEFPA